jgi:hypothetical protein
VKDETYLFVSDVKEKKITARSARHTRTHCGKGGRVRLPHDNLTKKELQKMNGECKSYRLNDPMSWQEFKSLPDDLKITYIKLLQKKFNVPFVHIGKMLGCAQRTISCEIIRLGLSEGKAAKGRKKKWDKEGFYAWWHGVDKLPTPVIEEIPCADPNQEEKPVHFYTEEEWETIFGEAKGYVEDDLPFEEPSEEPVPAPVNNFTPSLGIPFAATPINGSMQFKCPADQALNTLAQLLGNANCAISVMWRVIEESGAEDGKA